jgi:cytochrome P450
MGDERTAPYEQGFNHLGSQYATDPYSMWDDLRSECPIAHSDRFGSVWMPTTQEAVAGVAYDTEHFSSRDVGVVTVPDDTTLLVAPPISSDPPFHTDARRLLLPFFAPRAIDKMTPITQSIARELLDGFEGRTDLDVAEEYAKHIPVRVIARMIGLPESEEDQFTTWAVALLQEGTTNLEVGQQAAREVLAYFKEQVEDRRADPRDDLITELTRVEMGGAPLTDKHVIGTCFLLLVAGIDTTWSSISAGLWHLATHPDDLARLVAEPELIDTAIEEFLRAYAPVTMAREVTEDTEVMGCPMHKGEKVLLPFGASNRDPAAWDRPDEVLIDRAANRHVSFGIGIHRCVGSNLARMELKVAMQEWLTRFPNFTLDTSRDTVWAGSQVRGPRNVPLLLNQA